MKRYQFRLAQVLRIRQVQEDLAAAAFGAAQRDEAVAVAAERTRWDAINARPRPTGHVDAAQVIAQRTVWDAELDDLRRVTARRAAATAHTADERDSWLGAARRVRALELLDDRRREEHRIEADHDEAAHVDDLVSGRHIRGAENDT